MDRVEAEQPSRSAAARLAFAVAGGRTRLLRQHVPYPFHITRPFYLDSGRPDLATLYLQSASGGLYRGDEIGLDISVAARSAVWITTQSTTIVHDSRGRPARQTCQVMLGEQSLAIIAPDPLVLFPGALLANSIDVRLAAGAVAVLQDGFACHDPLGVGRMFETYEPQTRVYAGNGRLLVAERGRIEGLDLVDDASPLGPFSAAGNVYLLGVASPLPGAAALQTLLDATGCIAGIGSLPNGAGVGIRLLAREGGTLARGLDRALARAVQMITGLSFARRRK